MPDLILSTKEVQLLSQLYPPFSSKVVQTIEDLYTQMGLRFYALSGLRTFEKQEELWKIGRDGLDNIIGDIVTKAKPGYSWHNYGLACDCVLALDKERPALTLTWKDFVDLNKDGVNDWQTFGITAITNGLQWGGTFLTIKDVPHVQFHPGLDIKDALAIYTSTKKLQEVWNALRKQ